LTGDTIGTSDGTRRVYRKDYFTGFVSLGGNAMSPMSGAESNYNVIAVAREAVLAPIKSRDVDRHPLNARRRR
jgi:hypothetical protein